MAHTIVDRQIQKIGRYTKEYITVTFTSTSATPATLDTKLNVPLHGVVYSSNLDQGAAGLVIGTVLRATVIISNNVVTLSNRSGAAYNGNTAVIELTGY